MNMLVRKGWESEILTTAAQHTYKLEEKRIARSARSFQEHKASRTNKLYKETLVINESKNKNILLLDEAFYNKS